MSKATPADVETLGFAKEQFGSPSDWNAAAGYLQDILDDVALEVRDEVGATVYDAASSGTLNFKRIKTAEAYFAAAELWRRRKQYLEAAGAGNYTEAVDAQMRNCADSAAAAEAKAREELALVTTEPTGSGVKVGYVETGPYSEAGT